MASTLAGSRQTTARSLMPEGLRTAFAGFEVTQPHSCARRNIAWTTTSEIRTLLRPTPAFSRSARKRVSTSGVTSRSLRRPSRGKDVLVERGGVPGKGVVGQVRLGVDLPPLSSELLDSLFRRFDARELAERAAASQLGLEELGVLAALERSREPATGAPRLVPADAVLPRRQPFDHASSLVERKSRANLPSGSTRAGRAVGSNATSGRPRGATRQRSRSALNSPRSTRSRPRTL